MAATGGIIRCGGGVPYSVAILMLLLSCTMMRVSSLSLTVTNVECVYEFVMYEGDTVSGNFVVVDHEIFWNSDHPGIDLNVEAPGGNIVHTVKGTSGDKFEFKAPGSGMYKFCFHNPYSTPETVSFNIHVGHIPSEHDLAKNGSFIFLCLLTFRFSFHNNVFAYFFSHFILTEHLDPVNVKIAQLKEALESVTLEQKYLKARDTRHRHTNESTRKRVIFYTVGEYILLALVSGLQVVYIRRLFSKSVAYNRV